MPYSIRISFVLGTFFAVSACSTQVPEQSTLLSTHSVPNRHSPQSSMSPQFFTAALRFVLAHESVNKYDRGVDGVQRIMTPENGEQIQVSFAYPQKCKTTYKIIYPSVPDSENEFLDLDVLATNCVDEPQKEVYACVISDRNGSPDQRYQKRFMVTSTFTTDKQVIRLVVKEDQVGAPSSQKMIETVLTENQFSGFKPDEREFVFQVVSGAILPGVQYVKCEHPIYAGISIGN